MFELSLSATLLDYDLVPERSVHFRTTLWLTCSGQNYQKNKPQQKESNVPLGKFKSNNQIDRAWDSEIHQPYESWKSWTFSKLSDESAEENFLQKQLRLNFTTGVHGECEFSMIQGWMISCLLSICKAMTCFINNILITQTSY